MNTVLWNNVLAKEFRHRQNVADRLEAEAACEELGLPLTRENIAEAIVRILELRARQAEEHKAEAARAWQAEKDFVDRALVGIQDRGIGIKRLEWDGSAARPLPGLTYEAGEGHASLHLSDGSMIWDQAVDGEAEGREACQYHYEGLILGRMELPDT